jgi:hypothetical protein
MQEQPTDDQPVAPEQAGIIDTHQATVPQLSSLPNDGVTVHKVHSSRKWFKILLLVLVIGVAAGAGWWFGTHNNKTVEQPKTVQSTTQTTESTPKVEGLQLDPNKNYGDKYANGLLPVGDGKYDKTSAKAGSVYVCSQYAQNFANDKGGAGSRGPWFVNNNTQYDSTKKLHVNGKVSWKNVMSNVVSGSMRAISTNGLPTHTTGIFPIASSDTAYKYDRNPNSIKTQSLSYALPASPAYNQTPNCLGGEVGVMLTGVPIFNAFDAGGRDAGAWEVQDGCSGHPQVSGEYHYHTLSSCITDISVKTVIGYALDGFPITGPQVAKGNILTTSDLDECHGISSEIVVDGKTMTNYHYVMTQDFPYSASCFRSKAIQPPGQQPQGMRP